MYNRYLEINRRRKRFSGTDIRQATTLSDLQHLAQKQLPNFVYEYIAGGADDEITLRHNLDVFSQQRFAPYTLRDVSHPDTRITLFGKQTELPLAIAPTGLAGLFWPDGDVRLAEGAALAGVPMTQSTVSMSSIADVAAVPGLRHWFQLYCYGTPDIYSRLIERARESGSETLVVTTDLPVTGNRSWDRKNYSSPKNLSLRSKLDMLLHPTWGVRMLRNRKRPNFINLLEFLEPGKQTLQDVAQWINQHKNPGLSWKDIEYIRTLWPGKLVVKGILRPEDALIARDKGVDGIVVTNHGGRQLDQVVSPLEVLPAIRQAVQQDLTIFIDSGIRRGSDIAIALALGADAVLSGRATLYGLSADGTAGVTQALSILRRELETTLALNGLNNVSELSPDILVPLR
ncbi:alpha-hydroxy acid oxidase [Pantoea sp. A4]|uniref:alpha-hydroxy acid oxidase n=1 Tax=Pantoea sp. A4 TaxID=1225184 RepID=UPI000381F1F3|nr:alpha-hydroxy acid oxidase [Pantoea sp. A4]